MANWVVTSAGTLLNIDSGNVIGMSGDNLTLQRVNDTTVVITDTNTQDICMEIFNRLQAKGEIINQSMLDDFQI